MEEEFFMSQRVHAIIHPVSDIAQAKMKGEPE
jgi:hypothetical protein